MKALTVAVLFAGCGGSALGHHQAGDRLAYLNDNWRSACEALRQNFIGTQVDGRSVADIDGGEILEAAGGEVDVLDASPPCQDFSSAGKRNPSGDNAWLLHEVPRVVRVVRPRVLVIENVPGLRMGRARDLHFAPLVRELQGSGYRLAARELDGSMLGVPQARVRLLVVAVRSDLPVDAASAFPEYRDSRSVIRDALPSARALVRVARDCPDPRLAGYRDELSWPAGAPAPTVTTGGFSGGESQSTFGYSRIEEDDGSRRPVTVADVKALMGFPPGHRFPKGASDSAVLEMLGNAVPPPMARAWARSVARVLRSIKE